MLDILFNLWTYFGVVGLLAIVLAVGLLAWLVWFARRGRLGAVLPVAALAVLTLYTVAKLGGFGGYLFAVAWVLLGLCLLIYAVSRRFDGVGVLAVAAAMIAVAWGNSLQVSAIEALPSGKQKAIAEQMRKERLGVLTSHASSIRYAEDTQADRLDVAGVSEEKYESIYEAAAAGEGEVPAYKQGGKVARDEGKKKTDSDTKQLVEQQATREADATRKLPVEDMIAAQRYDRIALFAVRCLFLLAVVMVAIDYLRRLNRTQDSLVPLPLGGPWLDAIAPKSHAVHLHAGDPAAVGRFLRRSVGRGESFLFFGDEDPLPEAEAELPRLPLLLSRLWAMRVYRVRAMQDVPGPGYVLESLWFTRASFVVLGEAVRRPMLDALLAQLRMRRLPRARVRRTSHVVWRVDGPVAAPTLDDLVFLCRSANMKLVIVSNEPCPASLTARFEERLKFDSAAGLTPAV